MKEIRDIKIDLLMGNHNPIVDLFNEITKDLQIINCEVYNDDGLEFIYFNKDNEWIFYQDAKNDYFWCVYNRYWKIFESEFNFKYEEIQAITKYLVEEALKREVIIPNVDIYSKLNLVEDALKREVDTPMFVHSTNETWVEDALKREVAIPCAGLFANVYVVEEALKREVATPLEIKTGTKNKVEEALKREVHTPFKISKYL